MLKKDKLSDHQASASGSELDGDSTSPGGKVFDVLCSNFG